MNSRNQDDFHLIVDMADCRRVEKELRFAVDYFSANRLSESAKWASELLSSMENRKPANFSLSCSALQDSVIDDSLRKERINDNYEMEEEDEDIDSSTFSHEVYDYPIDKDLEFNYTFYERKTRSNDAVNLARILFDLREYRKACDKLRRYLHPSNQSAIFMYYYSLYMISEQQIEEEKYQSSEGTSRSSVSDSSK